MRTVADCGEFSLIERIRTQCPVSSGVLEGIGDDAAVFRIGKNRLGLLTSDMLVEGVHFTRRHPARQVGHKLIACSLSDIAAMGGVPRYAVISIALPADLPLRYITSVYSGLRRTADRFQTAVVGGDTNSCDRIVLSLTLWGEVSAAQVVFRRGARPGDWIMVTGSLGGSLQGRHLRFIPRVDEARFLVSQPQRPHAMIDVSDGLLQDLGHILRAGKVGAVIEESAVPCAKAAGGIADAYYSGEDFELLFAVAPAAGARLLRRWPFRGVALTRIGEVVSGRSLHIRMPDGSLRRPEGKGFRHFT